MSKKWHKGPPPSIGWWPASVRRDSSALRWWNGEYWSVGVLEGFSTEEIVLAAETRATNGPLIEWQHRPKSWPARSHT